MPYMSTSVNGQSWSFLLLLGFSSSATLIAFLASLLASGQLLTPCPGKLGGLLSSLSKNLCLAAYRDTNAFLDRVPPPAFIVVALGGL